MGTGEHVEQTIGAAGGTITLNHLTLTIPAGALAADTVIGVTSLPVVGLTGFYNPGPFGDRMGTPAYLLTPEGLTFSTDVTVSFELGRAPGANEAYVGWTTNFMNHGFLYDLRTRTAGATSVSATNNHFSCVAPMASSNEKYPLCPAPYVWQLNPATGGVGSTVTLSSRDLHRWSQVQIFFAGSSTPVTPANVASGGGSATVVVPADATTGPIRVRELSLPGWTLPGPTFTVQ